MALIGWASIKPHSKAFASADLRAAKSRLIDAGFFKVVAFVLQRSMAIGVMSLSFTASNFENDAFILDTVALPSLRFATTHGPYSLLKNSPNVCVSTAFLARAG